MTETNLARSFEEHCAYNRLTFTVDSPAYWAVRAAWTSDCRAIYARMPKRSRDVPQEVDHA